jgi:ribosomal protein L3 glutamine methyltransferase
MAQWPEVDFEWVRLSAGGHGVFVLSAAQCRQYQPLFSASLGGRSA